MRIGYPPQTPSERSQQYVPARAGGWVAGGRYRFSWARPYPLLPIRNKHLFRYALAMVRSGREVVFASSAAAIAVRGRGNSGLSFALRPIQAFRFSRDKTICRVVQHAHFRLPKSNFPAKPNLGANANVNTVLALSDVFEGTNIFNCGEKMLEEGGFSVIPKNNGTVTLKHVFRNFRRVGRKGFER